MRDLYLGIDPGMTTGVAFWYPEKELVHATQSPDVTEIFHFIRDFLVFLPDKVYLRVTVEPFIGAGYRSKESTHTTKVAGFFEFYFTTHELVDEPVRLAGSNMRLSGLPKAMKLLPEVEPAGPHKQDALAHAIVHSRMVAKG